MIQPARRPLHRYLALVRSWLWLAVLAAVIGGGVAYVVTAGMSTTYASSVRILVAPSLSSSQVNYNDILVGQALTETYADLATTRSLLDKVIAATGVSVSADELAGDVSTKVSTASSILTVTVTYKNPGDAARLANEIASQLAAYPRGSTGTTNSSVELTVVDPATDGAAQAPRTLFNGALGMAVGVAFAVCVAFLVENLRREDREEAMAGLGTPLTE